MLKFSEGKEERREVPGPSRSTGDALRESKGAEQCSVGASITPGSNGRVAFRYRLRTLLRPRIQTGGTQTIAWKGEPSWATRLGSFEDLEREVSRSRRFGHSFFLARLPRARTSADADGWHERTLALFSSLIRAVDRVWFDGRDVYLLLLESDRAMGTAALARLRGPLSELLSEEELDEIVFVVFAPDECPTSGALLSGLHRRAGAAIPEAAGTRGSAAAPVVDPDGAGG